VRNDQENPGKRVLNLPHGRLCPPLFMPDATFGVVRSLDSADLTNCGVQAVVMNAFHLMQSPGSSIIQTLGGLHAFSGWSGPIVTDSGGFQAYSLLRRNPRFGSLTNKGVFFRPEGSSRRYLLTPEKSIQLQLSFGADIVICLDDCTHVDEPIETQRESVDRTIDWAKRCKREFQQRVERSSEPEGERPLLFAVVQGGGSYKLRKECAESLFETGFDGFAYGGYPLDSNGNLLTDMIRFTRELVPNKFPMIALGIGQPSNVLECVKSGYDLFDSSMPTRDARQGRLYRFGREFHNRSESETLTHCQVYVGDKKYSRNRNPISSSCNCLTCTNYSLAYLHHLFRIRDPSYLRLATIHNLRFMSLLMENYKGQR
jgi:queuine tRNA-ribosyltransferase